MKSILHAKCRLYYNILCFRSEDQIHQLDTKFTGNIGYIIITRAFNINLSCQTETGSGLFTSPLSYSSNHKKPPLISSHWAQHAVRGNQGWFLQEPVYSPDRENFAYRGQCLRRQTPLLSKKTILDPNAIGRYTPVGRFQEWFSH